MAMLPLMYTFPTTLTRRMEVIPKWTKIKIKVSSMKALWGRIPLIKNSCHKLLAKLIYTQRRAQI
jgi:hypothetical protein